MKLLNSTLLLVLLAGATVAQFPKTAPSSSTGPSVVVLRSRWRAASPSPAFARDPLEVNERQANLQQGIIKAINANQVRVKADQPQVQIPRVGTLPNTPPSVRSNTLVPGHRSAAYTYEIRVRNTGTKTIRKLVWAYSLSDPAVGNLRSREYKSKTNIRPGGIKNLFADGGPPRGVVSVNQASLGQPEGSPDQVIIERVEYADGSVWTRRPR
ncbi:MAG: hypothetical protein QOH71_3157 [Blastocatellia bacterium]|jgi:hypothetical protein|nr:hypothetical protein [Blastocatellia bacterium]